MANDFGWYTGQPYWTTTRPGFGITGNDPDRLYGWGSGQTSRPGEVAGSNTLGYQINEQVFRDPIGRWVHRNTSGWLQDPGAAIVRWMGGPEAPAPAAPPPQMRQLQSTPGSANPAGSLPSQLRAQVLRRPSRGAQQMGTQQVNFGAGPNYAQNAAQGGVLYPEVMA